MSHLSSLTLVVVLTLGILLVGLAPTLAWGESSLAIGEEVVDANEEEIAAEMIDLIRSVSLARQKEDAQGVMRRFNQLKTIACVVGEMEVLTVAEQHRVGLFSKPKSYPVILRFANATKMDDRDADVRGLSIRVMDVDQGQGGMGIQDFTLNTHPALFAGTPEIFLSFIRATEADRQWWFFITHPMSLWNGFKGRKNPTSPLSVDYHSATPILFGTGMAIKYATRSCSATATAVADDHAEYLRDALQHDLQSEQCIDFQVQFQTDVDLMPIEDAAVTWPEDISPFVTLAKIKLPPQTLEIAECEKMTFNPWNALAQHRPLGGINRVRRQVYDSLGKFRNEHNSVD